ncbi:MAG: hypothetical protein CEE43_16135 [Promethearchaeota archaeon Loki_b32]|nr:MAG: hypothetical protein CEE43_16135 [Candidatus Lokiarchaeota archaeon Loki_b32]
MKKIGKASLVLLVFSVFLLGIGPTTVFARYHSDYENASQKILEEIKSFTFTYDSRTLRYNIIFGARFIKHNDNISELVSDVFVFTAGELFVTDLTAILTFDASFSYDGTLNKNAGAGYDSTSLFQIGDLLYSYNIHSFNITNHLFPLELEITFVYDFTSDDEEFSESGTYNVVKSFTLKSSGFKIPGYILSTTISILVVGILAVAMIYKRKKILKINNS